MYTILKNVISRKAFNLSEMLTKIDTLWSENKITDSEREELITLARDNATIEHSVNVVEKLIELEQRIITLETKKAESSNTTEAIEDYKAGKWYYRGNKMLFNGKVYECTAEEGTAVYWSPIESGLCWRQLN